MLHNKIWSTVTTLGLLLAIPTGIQAAEMPMHNPNTTQFRRIEQPLPLRLVVTLGGLGLIGLELWWFLFSKTPAQQAIANQGIQEITIKVDGGYNPNRLVVKLGQPVRLNFFRQDPNSCLEQVLFPDFQIATYLALNQVTPVEFTPQKPGEYSFTCGMNMFRGVLEVGASREVASREHRGNFEVR